MYFIHYNYDFQEHIPLSQKHVYDKKVIAKEHRPLVYIDEIERYGINKDDLIAKDSLYAIIKTSIKVAKKDGDISQSFVAISLLREYLGLYPPVSTKIPLNLEEHRRKQLLENLSAWIFWTFYERCYFTIY